MIDRTVARNWHISQQKLMDTVRARNTFAKKAFSTSHFWGRTFRMMAYYVRLITTLLVNAFVRSQKNDANDELVICETACRPGIHFVPVKPTDNRTYRSTEDYPPGAVWFPGSTVRGNQRLSSVIKNGNRSHRTLIIHGAWSAMGWVIKRDDNLLFTAKPVRPDGDYRKSQLRAPHNGLSVAEDEVADNDVSGPAWGMR